MIAQELISTDIIPVKPSDTGEYALNLMSDNLVKHLPIVSEDNLLGVISESDILSHDLAKPIESYNLSMNRPFAEQDMHIYEIMAIMSEHRLTVIPITNYKNTYLGAICLEDLLHYFAKSFSFSEPGSIIVLEMHKSDYSLVELSQIIESERAAILSTFISTHPDSMKVHVTIKVNKHEIGDILASLERHEIYIKASYSESEVDETLMDRYDSLMKYLSV